MTLYDLSGQLRMKEPRQDNPLGLLASTSGKTCFGLKGRSLFYFASGFRDRPIQPLSHLSGAVITGTYGVTASRSAPS